MGRLWRGRNVDDQLRRYTIKKLFSFLLILGLFIPSLGYCADITTYVFGATQTLPKTGQTTSYQDGDDGYYEKGSASTPQFVDNGDGTISDKATGLMWIKQPRVIIPGVSVRADNQIQVAHGDWVTSHAYIIGDLVSRDATDAGPPEFYVCIVAIHQEHFLMI